MMDRRTLVEFMKGLGAIGKGSPIAARDSKKTY
jgi:hypothetical protein